MARPKRDQILRHEVVEEEEDGFVKTSSTAIRQARESAVVVVAKPKQGKGKRSVEDMLASMPNKAAQAAYAMERIAALEDQIARILELCSPETRAIVLDQRKSLARYAPDADE